MFVLSGWGSVGNRRRLGEWIKEMSGCLGKQNQLVRMKERVLEGQTSLGHRAGF